MGGNREAKLRIRDGQVQVNGQVEYRRGRQLAAGDQIDLEGETAIVPEEPQRGFKLAAAEQQRSKRAQTGDRRQLEDARPVPRPETG